MPSCRVSIVPSRLTFDDALPIGNRRNGRLAICATLNRCARGPVAVRLHESGLRRLLRLILNKNILHYSARLVISDQLLLTVMKVEQLRMVDAE